MSLASASMRRLFLATCIVVFAQSQPLATPLAADAEASAAGNIPQGWIPLSAEALVLSDARVEMATDLAVLGTPAKGGANHLRDKLRRTGAANEAENPAGLDPGSSLLGAGIRDLLRNYVNVDRGSADTARGAERRRGPQGETLGLAAVDIGPAANEWIQETVASILDSALRLDADDRGRVSFSVLGLGDFSFNLSGDRSQVALAAGDTVLLTAQRVGPHSGGGPGGGYESAVWQGHDFPGATGSGTDRSPTTSPVREAIDLLMDMASHPLSFLVYALIGTYLLLWSILSRRSVARSDRAMLARAHRLPPRAPDHSPAPQRAGKQRRRHRGRPSNHRT